MPKIEIDVSDEEDKDIEEFREENKLKTKGEAVRQMAGVKTYRMLKQKTDPDRKKKSFVARQDLGIPEHYPCALSDFLGEMGLTYETFINQALAEGIRTAELALAGDKDAQQAIQRIVRRSSE